MRRTWFGDYTDLEFIPCTRDTKSLADRFREYSREGILFPKPVCEDAITGGFVPDRVQYLQELRNLSLYLVTSELGVYFRSSEARLIQLIRILDECDRVVSRLSEQVLEWERFHIAGQNLLVPLKSDRKTLSSIADSRKDGISELSREILRLMDVRKRVADEIIQLSSEVIPNVSAILGNLVASRLLMQAGGLRKLANLSSSSIQVIGARYALFSHIRSKTPPPKHGIIYQHKRIHASPKRVRGAVSRTLASQVAIAARIDHFRGERDLVFLKRSEDKIRTAGERR